MLFCFKKKPSGSPDSPEENHGLYYGWIVVAACLFVGFIALGTRLSFGVFFKSLESDFGWSRATTSGVFSIYMILSSIFGMLGGWALDRYGPRVITVVMTFFISLSLLLTSHASSLWQFYLTYSLLLAIGTGPAFTMATSTTIRWFRKRRGLAVGIVTSGRDIGILIMAPFSAWLIASYGWRDSYAIMALIAFLGMIPCALVLKGAPGEASASNENDSPHTSNLGSSENHESQQPGGFSFSQAMADKNFWLIFISWFLWASSIFIVSTHLVPYATDLGIDPIKAASVFGLSGGASILGRVLTGRVSDSIGRKLVVMVCILITTGTMLWLAASTNLWMLCVFAITFGFFSGGQSAAINAITGDIFGLRRIGLILGSLNIAWGIGAAFGPTLAGYIFDTTGNYVIAFLAGMVAMLLAAIALLFIKTKKSTA